MSFFSFLFKTKAIPSKHMFPASFINRQLRFILTKNIKESSFIIKPQMYSSIYDVNWVDIYLFKATDSAFACTRVIKLVK